MEIWKPIPGYEGLYEVSDCGRVRRMAGSRDCKVTRIRATHDDTHGYPHIALYRDNKEKRCKVHLLVLLAFVGPRPSGKQTNHKDGNRANPHLSNLEYVTPSENERHKIDVLKNWNGPRGEKGWRSKRPPLKRIAGLIGQGLSDRAIARELNYSCHKIVGVVRRGHHWTQRPH